MSSFGTELSAEGTSLSAPEVNYWTSNPIGGVRYEIQLTPMRAIGVAESGSVAALLVSSGDARAALAPSGEEGPIPPNTWGRAGKMLDYLGGRQRDKQPDSRSGRTQSASWVFYSHLL